MAYAILGLVGERNRGDLRWPPRQQLGEPRPVLGAALLGVADHGQRTGGDHGRADSDHLAC